MIAVSTSFASKGSTGPDLVRRLVRLDIRAVELEYRITAAAFAALQDPLKQAGVRVTSVHNYFPVPPEFPASMASGDLFNLADLDRDARQEAVRHTVRTIEHANALEAKAVVLHCGRTDMVPEMDRLYAFLDADELESEAARAFIHRKQAERNRKRGPFLDALCFSMEALIRAAERENVLLGLENRFYYSELPDSDDFEILFADFHGAPVGYWHDAGHAHANETLTLVEPGSLLGRFGDRLIGVHLHDAVKTDDHRPPGTGDIDFKTFAEKLAPETLRVLELKSGTPDEGVTAGLKGLAEAGIV